MNPQSFYRACQETQQRASAQLNRRRRGNGLAMPCLVLWAAALAARPHRRKPMNGLDERQQPKTASHPECMGNWESRPQETLQEVVRRRLAGWIRMEISGSSGAPKMALMGAESTPTSMMFGNTTLRFRSGVDGGKQ